jgi:hypothetical protein
MRYRVIADPRRERLFEICREGWGPVGTFGGSAEDAQEYAARCEREEDVAERALASEDPLALCEIGWHRGEDRFGREYYFRRRHGWGGCWLAYHVAPRPFEYCGRTVGSFDTKSEPWGCSACGRLIGRAAAPGMVDLVELPLPSSNGHRADWQP